MGKCLQKHEMKQKMVKGNAGYVHLSLLCTSFVSRLCSLLPVPLSPGIVFTTSQWWAFLNYHFFTLPRPTPQSCAQHPGRSLLSGITVHLQIQLSAMAAISCDSSGLQAEVAASSHLESAAGCSSQLKDLFFTADFQQCHPQPMTFAVPLQIRCTEMERDAEGLVPAPLCTKKNLFYQLYLPSTQVFYDPSANLQTKCWAQYHCIHDLHWGSANKKSPIP